MLSNFPALVTVLALLLYVGVFVAAGRARGRYGVEAPAVTGAPVNVTTTWSIELPTDMKPG